MPKTHRQHLAPRRAWTLEERFLQKVEKTPTCWIWRGAGGRYGKFLMPGIGSTTAHRASWVLFRGPVKDGWQVDHLCMVRLCVNPDHLEPVPPVVNVYRERRARLRGPIVAGHETAYPVVRP